MPPRSNRTRVDQLVSLGAVGLAVAWLQRPQSVWPLWTLAAAMPLAWGFRTRPCSWRAGSAWPWPSPWFGSGSTRLDGLALLRASLLASFAGYYALCARKQSDLELSLMVDLWNDAFPPLDSPAKLLAWLVGAHTGPLFAQPLGGDHGGSTATFLLCAVAVGLLWRRRQTAACWPCARRRWPSTCWRPSCAAIRMADTCAGHARQSAGLPHGRPGRGGGAGPVGRTEEGGHAGAIREPAATTQCRSPLPRRFAVRTLPLLVLLALLGAVGAVSMIRDFRHPAKSMQDLQGRDFAGWFWPTLARDHEVVCLKTDWGLAFPPAGRPWEQCISMKYLCNQRIYSPRHARGEPPHEECVSRRRPLACVQYRSHDLPYDQRAFAAWLDGMKCAMRCKRRCVTPSITRATRTRARNRRMRLKCMCSCRGEREGPLPTRAEESRRSIAHARLASASRRSAAIGCYSREV